MTRHSIRSVSRRAAVALLAIGCVSQALTPVANANAAPANQVAGAAATTSADPNVTYRLYPIRQGGTGAAEWDNCGPASATMAVYALGKTPRYWKPSDGFATEVTDMRVTAMGAAPNYGTSTPQLQRAFTYYGLGSNILEGASTINAVLNAAKSRRVSILYGNARALPTWYGKNLTSGTSYAGHYVVLGGHDPATGKYLVMDPLSAAGYNTIHPFTAAEVQRFMESGRHKDSNGNPTNIQRITSVTSTGARPSIAPVMSQLTLSGYGDFTGDGRSDVVGFSSGRNDGGFTVYPGTGTGVTGQYYFHGAGWNMYNAVLRADFDGDGRQDLIARTKTGGGLLMFYKSGGGPAVQVAGTAGWGQFDALVSPGDLTGDGRADILARQADGEMYLYPGTNGPGVSTPRLISAGWGQYKFITAVGDMNKDGKPDIVAAKSSGGDLLLFLGGAGNGVAYSKTIGSGWNTLRGLTGLSDFNRDGYVDVAGIDPASPYVLRIYKGQNNATWPFSGAFTKYGEGWHQYTGLL